MLGNDQTVPDLVARITSTNGVPWRDGLPYQHNLTAVRHVIDSQDAGIWTNNIYTGWLAALRALVRAHHRSRLSRGDANPGLGHENAQCPARLLDRTAA